MNLGHLLAFADSGLSPPLFVPVGRLMEKIGDDGIDGDTLGLGLGPRDAVDVDLRNRSFIRITPVEQAGIRTVLDHG